MGDPVPFPLGNRKIERRDLVVLGQRLAGLVLDKRHLRLVQTSFDRGKGAGPGEQILERLVGSRRPYRVGQPVTGLVGRAAGIARVRPGLDLLAIADPVTVGVLRFDLAKRRSVGTGSEERLAIIVARRPSTLLVAQRAGDFVSEFRRSRRWYIPNPLPEG